MIPKVYLLCTSSLDNGAINLYKLAEFYGLECEKINLQALTSHANILPSRIVEENPFIAFSAKNLSDSQIKNLDFNEIVQFLTSKKSTVFIYDICEGLDDSCYDRIASLTGITDLRVGKCNFSQFQYSVCDDQPQFTNTFSGLSLGAANVETDFSASLGRHKTRVKNLISVNEKPIFFSVRSAIGDVYCLTSRQMAHLEEAPMEELFSPQRFSQLAPTMMLLRSFFGEYCWNAPETFANFTIDDPLLVPNYGYLNYRRLLKQMDERCFHTTIAFIPWNYKRSREEVIRFFLQRPDRLSLAIHGCDHDHYEFSLSKRSSHKKELLREHEGKIRISLQRMDRHREITGIPYDRIMIFPHGICPQPTLRILKQQNFLATVNNGIIPIGKNTRKPAFMEPATLDYENFPLVMRRHPHIEYSIFDAFVGRPILLYEHHSYLKDGLKGLNEIVDRVNSLPGGARWANLGTIMEHLCLQKAEGGKKLRVRMYTSQLRIKNSSAQTLQYSIEKRESLNVPISEIVSNKDQLDHEYGYGLIRMKTTLNPGEELNVRILYKQDSNFGQLEDRKKTRVFILRHLSEIRDNYFSRTRIGAFFISIWEKIRLLFT